MPNTAHSKYSAHTAIPGLPRTSELSGQPYTLVSSPPFYTIFAAINQTVWCGQTSCNLCSKLSKIQLVSSNSLSKSLVRPLRYTDHKRQFYTLTERSIKLRCQLQTNHWLQPCFCQLDEAVVYPHRQIYQNLPIF